MSDTLALLALMKKDEGLTEEQVNQVIDNKNLQPKLTAGENITISADNVISATDTGLTQEQVNTLIDSKNLQPKLTAGTNITIQDNVISSTDTGVSEEQVNTLIDNKNLQPKLTAGTNITIQDNVISSTDTGLNETEVNTLIDNKNLQPKLTAGENITISADNVISATSSGGGSSYTFTDGLTETAGTVKWDLNDRIEKGTGTHSLVINTNPQYKAKATGENSLSIGYGINNQGASGKDSIVIGWDSEATNNQTIAIGNLASCRSRGGVAIGSYATVVKSNQAAPSSNIAIGDSICYPDTWGSVIAIGRDASSYGKDQMSLGFSNIRDENSKYTLIVGNGTGNEDRYRNNALAIEKSTSNMYTSGNVYVGCTDYTTSADGLVTENCGGKKLITGDEVNTLIDAKLGVIENGSY